MERLRRSLTKLFTPLINIMAAAAWQNTIVRMKKRKRRHGGHWVPHPKSSIFHPDGHQKWIEDMNTYKVVHEEEELCWVRSLEEVHSTPVRSPTGSASSGIHNLEVGKVHNLELAMPLIAFNAVPSMLRYHSRLGTGQLPATLDLETGVTTDQWGLRSQPRIQVSELWHWQKKLWRALTEQHFWKNFIILFNLLLKRVKIQN